MQDSEFCTAKKISILHIKCKYSKQWKRLYERKREFEREFMTEKEKLEAQLEYELEKIFLRKRIVSEYRCVKYCSLFLQNIQIITFYTLQRNVQSRFTSK